MAFKEKQILSFFLFICFSFIKVNGFAVFNDGTKFGSLGSFYKSARTKESFDRGDEKPKSEEQVGRLLVWQDRASHSHGDISDRFSSNLGIQSRPDETAYQSDDSGWMKLQPLWGQVYGPNTMYTPTVERLLDMKPKVDCVGDMMKLTVHGREAPFGSSFLIDRGSLQPLPLSQLPSECGHRFLRTWRDFAFIIPYDGCYVSQEKNTFVLPLLWWGLPVKMSCSSPTLVQRAPTVSCYTNGMIVRLYRGASENLMVKVINEWQPLLKGSARCGYSLVSHAEGVVIHAPYMPCTEPKDGMFTLSMAMEEEFNLSCPALTVNLPISLPDRAPANYIQTSMLNAPISPKLPSTTVTTTTTTKTTQPITTRSTVQKLPTPPLPYYIPGQPNFKPVPPSYPFLPFPPNVPPKVLPQGPTIAAPPTAITQQPQTPVYIKRPPTWYPWNPKPSMDLTPVPSQSPAFQYPRKQLLLPPTKAPKTPLSPLLKPTSIPQDKLTSTMPVVPPVQWAPMFPPRNLVHPLNDRKPEFVAPSNVFPQNPYWPYYQNKPGPPKPEDAPPKPKDAPTKPKDAPPKPKDAPPKPKDAPPKPKDAPPKPKDAPPKPNDPPPKPKDAPPKPKEAPPMPSPTREAGPQLFHPWYNPFPPRLPVMLPVPTKVPPGNIVSTSGAVASGSTTYQSVDKGHPIKPKSDISQIPYPTPSTPKFPDFNIHAPINTCLTPICLSHALSLHGQISCPCPPLISYHHHNHHYFGHPPVFNLDPSSRIKISGQIPSSPVISAGSTQFVQGMGYSYGPLSSGGSIVPPASDNTAIQYLANNPIIKGFRKLDSTNVSTWSSMKPANVAPVIGPLGPSRPLQKGPVAEPLVYSNQSLKPAIYQAEMERYVPPQGPLTQALLVAPNKVPFFEKMVQYAISLKPTMPPAHGKNLYMNHWYQATYSNARPPISDSPTKDSFSQLSLPQPSNKYNPFEPSATLPQSSSKNPFEPSATLPQSSSKNPFEPSATSPQPEQISSSNLPVMNPLQYNRQSGESVVPFFRNTYWVPAVQTNQDALLSRITQKDPSTVVKGMQRAGNTN
ncbi:histone-lysine N-methyltransferase 2D-like [Pseudorasbora parva]|uniref:histone-lysine N-methyltransferase 2D-like n=1 Tax=Pseudorasbora parva TaxID=51549 RepID=UPI00351EF953